MPNLRYTISTGTPSEEERSALEIALRQHVKPVEISATRKSVWARPQLRAPLQRKS